MSQPKISSKRLNRDAYRVGWFCPLEVEQIAAMEMLDEEHQPIPQPRRDTNVYHLGSINNHNIVIAGLPRAGNCSAATVVTHMKRTFPNLTFGLLVGIGGGVPVETDQGMIRLGHVVVSEPTGIYSGAIQYDHGKAREGRFERKGSLAHPPIALLNAAREVAVRRRRIDYDPIWKNLERIQTDRPTLRPFKFPGIENDHLYPSNYIHQHENSSCEDGGCDQSRRIERLVDPRIDSVVVVHRGTIASGELVIKNAKKRDDLAREHKVLCFEMEAAGALTDFPCLVIRGISDYCDSHKNDDWHGYAAAVAAAYARQLFFHMPHEEIQGNPSSTPTFELPLNISNIHGVEQFVAREEELQRVHGTLMKATGRRVATVHGLGGMGKTQLAIAYMKHHRSEYSAALWMNARDETALKQSYAGAAECIQRHHPYFAYISAALQSLNLDNTVQAVKRWLDEPENNHWLIVYDNYDNPLLSDPKGKSPCQDPEIGANSCGDEDGDSTRAFDLRAFLPEADHGKIVVTTRSSMVKLGQNVHLGKMEDTNDGLQVLASTSGRKDFNGDPAALSLAKELDGLPLALATAGAHLNQVSMTCAEYLQLYRESWRQLHEETPQLPGYDQALYSTWNISYHYIQQQSSIAATLLRQWAYFANNDLWYELLESCWPEPPEWLEELTKSKLKFHTTMRLLCSVGLVEASQPTESQGTESSGGGYNVHGCVHSWMTHVLSPVYDDEMALTAAKCVSEHSSDEDKPESWLIRRRLIPHADRCLENIGEIELKDEAVDIFCLLGRLYNDQDRYHEAEVMYKRALKVTDKSGEQDHIHELDILHSLGAVYRNQGRFSEAEAVYERITQGDENGMGQEHDLRLMQSIGFLYSNQGRFKEAEMIYKRVLEGYEKTLGREDISTLLAVGETAVLYMVQGRLEEAEAMFVRAMEGSEKIFGREHISTLWAINDTGMLYMKQGRLEEAEAMLVRAMEGFEKIFGREYISTLLVINDTGMLYVKQGRLEEAEAMLVRAMEGLEKNFGREHISTIAVFDNAGLLYAKQGRLEEAEAMYLRALEGCEKALGPTQTEKYGPGMETLENIADLYVELGRVDDALKYYRRAVSGTEATMGRDSQRFSDLSSKVSSLQCDMRRASGEEVGIRSRYRKTTQLKRQWQKLRASFSIMYKSR